MTAILAGKPVTGTAALLAVDSPDRAGAVAAYTYTRRFSRVRLDGATPVLLIHRRS